MFEDVGLLMGIFMVLILLTIFFGYLMLRRTVLGFQEGYDQGRR